MQRGREDETTRVAAETRKENNCPGGSNAAQGARARVAVLRGRQYQRTHYDDQGVLRYGTKAFCGGAKVYLCGKYWTRKQRTIGVIGLNRYKRYVCAGLKC